MFYLAAEATVNFSAPSFTSVEENGFAEICVVLLNSTEREVNVTLIATDTSGFSTCLITEYVDI